MSEESSTITLDEGIISEDDDIISEAKIEESDEEEFEHFDEIMSETVQETEDESLSEDEGFSSAFQQLESELKIPGEIPKDKRITGFRQLTKYERTRCIGLRVEQLSSGAPPNLKIDFSKMTNRQIAEKELRKGKLTFIIRRNLPNNKYETFHINELIR